MLELHPQARNREEERWPCPLKILNEGVQRLCKIKLEAGIQRAQLHKGALKYMSQRQVGQHALTGPYAQSLDTASSGERHVIEAEHNAFRATGTARGVHDGGQLFLITPGFAFQWRVLGNNVVPGLEIVGRAQRIGNAANRFRHTGFHTVPVIQFTHEQHVALGVVEDVVHGIGVQGGIQRHGNVPGHPDGPVCHHPLGAVLGNQTNPAFLRQVQGFQVRRHPACLIHGTAPGVLNHLTVANGLRHIKGIRAGGLPVVDHIQGELFRCVHGPS